MPYRFRTLAPIAIAIALLPLGGCARRAVLEKLPRREANRCLVVLQAAGLDATIDGTGAEAGITVGGDEVAYRSALQVLEDHGLPRREPAGFEASGASLIPSPSEERARYIKGLSGEIEALLESVDGIVTAEALVSLPERKPLSTPTEPASASVVLSFAGSTSPIADQEVRDVVVRSIGTDISGDRVSVLLKPVVRPDAPQPLIRYERDRVLDVSFVACVALLAALQGVSIWRLRRARRAHQPEVGHVA